MSCFRRYWSWIDGDNDDGDDDDGEYDVDGEEYDQSQYKEITSKQCSSIAVIKFLHQHIEYSIYIYHTHDSASACRCSQHDHDPHLCWSDHILPTRTLCRTCPSHAPDRKTGRHSNHTPLIACPSYYE